MIQPNPAHPKIARPCRQKQILTYFQQKLKERADNIQTLIESIDENNAGLKDDLQSAEDDVNELHA